MNTDVFTKIGTSHRDCQDYALHGESQGNPYVIVCDGCSGAPNSDFGARILAKSAEKLIDYLQNRLTSINTHEALFYNMVLHQAASTLPWFNLPEDSLCATLLTITVEPEGKDDVKTFIARCVGDGVVLAHHKNGNFLVFEYEFPSGAPYYLRYELDKELMKSYFEGNANIVKRTTVFGYNGEIVSYNSENAKLDPTRPYFEHHFALDVFDFVAVSTDGMASFQNKVKTNSGIYDETIGTDKAIQALMTFKSFSGEFVYRKCHRAFKKLEEMNWRNTDDFTLGAMSNVTGDQEFSDYSWRSV